jgi:4-hydroxybenzoate polyprenyltransferase
MAVAYPISMMIVSPLLSLGGSNIGQGAITFLFVWIGVWAVAVFCAACLATAQLNDWWNRRSG